MESVSPVRPPLFEDPLAGEEDDNLITSPLVRHFIPAALTCVADMKRFWDKNRGMEDLGMADPTPVEMSVVNSLHQSCRATLSSNGDSLPGKSERFATSVFQKIYKSSAVSPHGLSSRAS